MATRIFPVIHKSPIFNIKENGAHFLGMFADDLLFIGFLVQKLGHSYMRAEKVFKDSVDVCIEGLRLDRGLLNGRRVLEIAILDMVIARQPRLLQLVRGTRRCFRRIMRRPRQICVVLGEERLGGIRAVRSIRRIFVLMVGGNPQVPSDVGGIFAEALFKSLHKVHQIFHGVLLVPDGARIA